jgi:citrate synthase
VRALSLFFILHADHEQNCSCSTVRMVGSTRPAVRLGLGRHLRPVGPAARRGQRRGLRMLENIRDGHMSIPTVLEKVKNRQMRLMGFGHRIYKNYDPRATILKQAAHDLLCKTGCRDELLDFALNLAAAAMADDFFTERKLYPNVDFYSGLILRALNIPV